MALLARHHLLLKQARCAETLALLAGRGYASQATLEVELPGAAADSLAGTTASELGGSAGAALEAAATGAGDVGSVLSATMAAIDSLHAASGLPWWATIAAVGVGVRTTMLPVTLQGMRASGALLPMLRQAREEAAASLATPPASKSSSSSTSGPGLAARQRALQQQQQEQQTQQQQQQQRQPTPAQVLERFRELQQQSGAPHPIWVVASPLLQLPVFITAMAAVRTMSLTGWPGFSTGGTSWFPDLTLPAMDLATLTAPLGTAGVVLPLGITLAMFANIDAAFSVPAGAAGRQRQGSGAVMLWAMGTVRLVLEWMLVPLFAVALQLPHGALCYWATSSMYALGQNMLLRQPAVRRLVGLPAGPAAPAGVQPPPAPAAAAGAPAAASSAGGSGTAGQLAASPEAAAAAAELRQFLATTSDHALLFQQAAELRAEGRAGAAAAVLQRLLALHPGHPRALFALGQVYGALKDWPASEQHYMEATRHETDSHQRARSWFGAAVALHMQQENETAIEAFQRAAEAAQSANLRARAWVSQATLHKGLGQLEEAAQLLRKAAKADPKVEELYLKPLLEEMAQAQKQQP